MQNDRATAQRNGSSNSVDLQTIVFAPITGAGLVQQTTRRLTEAIIVGLLKEGDQLPSEAQLSNRLGISPMTLREALATLRNAGYIETRRGRGGGNFIRRPRPSVKPAAPAPGIDLDYLYDLADYRWAIQSEAAVLAADRASPAELDDLTNQVETIDRGTDFPTYARLGAQFRIGVAAASGSKRLWREQTVIEMELNGIVLTNPKRPTKKQLEPVKAAHSKLLAALRKRDPSRARSIVDAEMATATDVLVALLFGGGRRARST